MTGVGSAINIAKVERGESVVVMGCGGVGLSAIQGARIAFAGRIIAVDLHESRLARAAELGATHTIQARPDDAGHAHLIQDVLGTTGTPGAATPSLGHRRRGTALR